MQERDRIIQKVFHLLQKTTENGATEAEAMTAVVKAGELMDHYNINITDVEVKQSDCVEGKFTINSQNRTKIDAVFVGIAAYCDVKAWFSKNRKGNSSYRFYGLKQDVEMAEYLSELVFDTHLRALKEFKNGSYYKSLTGGEKRSATASFSQSFGNRVCNRLEKIKQERDEHVNREQERTGRGLVLVKKEHIEEQFKKHTGIKLKKYHYNKITRDHQAAIQGSKAGNNVNFDQPIKNKHRKQLVG